MLAKDRLPVEAASSPRLRTHSILIPLTTLPGKKFNGGEFSKLSTRPTEAVGTLKGLIRRNEEANALGDLTIYKFSLNRGEVQSPCRLIRNDKTHFQRSHTGLQS